MKGILTLFYGFILFLFGGAIFQIIESNEMESNGYDCKIKQIKTGPLSHNISKFYYCKKNDELVVVGFYGRHLSLSE